MSVSIDNVHRIFHYVYSGKCFVGYSALFCKDPLTYISGSERGLIQDSGCPLTYYVIHEILI